MISYKPHLLWSFHCSLMSWDPALWSGHILHSERYAPVMNKQSNSDIHILNPRQTLTSKQCIGKYAYFYLIKNLVSRARTNLLFTPFLHYLVIFLFIFSFNHRFKISFFNRLSRFNSFQVQVWMFSVKDLSNGFYIEFKVSFINP